MLIDFPRNGIILNFKFRGKIGNHSRLDEFRHHPVCTGRASKFSVAKEMARAATYPRYTR